MSRSWQRKFVSACLPLESLWDPLTAVLNHEWDDFFFFFTYKPRRKVILLLMKESIYNSILTDLWLYIIIFHLNGLSLQIGLVSPFQLLVYLSAIYCLILFFNPIFFNTYMSSLNGGL